MTIAAEESAAASGERDAAERVRLMEVLGADPSARTQPPHIRAAAQPRSRGSRRPARPGSPATSSTGRSSTCSRSTATRSSLRTGAGTALVNEDSRQVVQRVCELLGPDDLLRAMDAIGTARERIGANVNPLLALEAMALDLRLPR